MLFPHKQRNSIQTELTGGQLYSDTSPSVNFLWVCELQKTDWAQLKAKNATHRRRRSLSRKFSKMNLCAKTGFIFCGVKIIPGTNKCKTHFAVTQWRNVIVQIDLNARFDPLSELIIHKFIRFRGQNSSSSIFLNTSDLDRSNSKKRFKALVPGPNWKMVSTLICQWSWGKKARYDWHPPTTSW